MTAPNDEGPAGGPTLPEQQRTSDTAEFTSQPEDLQTAERAHFEHLRAILVQRGITLLPNGADRYTVQRGRLTQDLRDLDAVGRFAGLIGGAV